MTFLKTAIGVTTALSFSIFFAPAANAALLTFDLTGFTDGGDPTSITSGGIILTASNFDSGFCAPIDSDRLCIAGKFSFCLNFQGTTQDVLSSLTLSFSAPVQLIGYTPGFVNNVYDTADQWITTFSQGGNSSVETNWVDEQPTTFANQILEF